MTYINESVRNVNVPVKAKISIPGSKSITIRALLIASLADGVSEIFNLQLSRDTRAMRDALHNLGIVIQLDEAAHSCIIAGCSGKFPKTEAILWCDSSGATARFLLAACAASSGTFRFDATAQLRRRPLQTLLKVLKGQGVKFTPPNAAQMPFALVSEEGLDGGAITVDGSETSQFLSALLISSPFAKSSMILETNNLVSVPYIDMTLEMMKEFGVLVHRMHQTRFAVPVPQRYQARDYVIEPDLSTASYFFAAAAITAGEVTIPLIDRETSKQADIKFLTVLEKMGCHVTEEKSGVTVIGTRDLQGVNVDMRGFSDTFLTLAAIAPFAKTPTTITNIGHARLKESDRIKVMFNALEKMQVKVEQGRDWLKVYPSIPKAAKIDSHDDHRVVMAFTLMGLRVPGIEISNPDCVAKTCPEFFQLWKQLTS